MSQVKYLFPARWQTQHFSNLLTAWLDEGDEVIIPARLLGVLPPDMTIPSRRRACGD